MATYAFELHGCNGENLAAVLAALVSIPGLHCSIGMSARGVFVVFVQSELTESEVIELINKALAHLHVSVGLAPKPPKPKF